MKTVLYLGTDPTHFSMGKDRDRHLIHFPVIQIIPNHPMKGDLKHAYDQLEKYTHLIFTSKHAVKIFFEHLTQRLLPKAILTGKVVIAIGQVTAFHLRAEGLNPTHIADEESQEGLIQLLKRLDLNGAYFFLPRSSLSRPLITAYFQEKAIRFHASDLYHTQTRKVSSVPDLTRIDEIIFTSPSTVRGFIEIFGALPQEKQLFAIGPVTRDALEDLLKE